MSIIFHTEYYGNEEHNKKKRNQCYLLSKGCIECNLIGIDRQTERKKAYAEMHN